MDTTIKVKFRELIALSRRQQELYFDTIGDAAALAAEQVQDKRLEFLEQVHETFGIQQLFDSLIALALSGIAGALLNKMTEFIFKPLINLRMAVITRDIKFKVSLNGLQLAQKVRISERMLKKDTREYDFYRNVADKLLGAGLDKAKEKLTPGKRSSSKPVQTEKDSPGVSVLNVVQNSMRQQKAAIGLVHDYLDIGVQNDMVDDELASKLQTFLQDNVKVPKGFEDLSEFKEHYKLLYEAAIWSLLFDPYKIIEKIMTKPSVPIDISGPFEREEVTVPDELLRYWIDRFPHPGYKNYQGSFGSTHRPSGADHHLVAYFQEIRSYMAARAIQPLLNAVIAGFRQRTQKRGSAGP